MSTGATGTLLLVLAIVGLIVLVLWVLLPFALFGVKPLLRQLVHEQRRTNELLYRMLPK